MGKIADAADAKSVEDENTAKVSQTAADAAGKKATADEKTAKESQTAVDAAGEKATADTKPETKLTASMITPDMLMLPAAVVGGAIGGGIVLLLSKATQHSSDVPLLTA